MADPDDAVFPEVTRKGPMNMILADRFLVMEEIGHGAMGTVYSAVDLEMNRRKVAIKMPAAMLARSDAAVSALREEARVAMKLSHPNIITLRAFAKAAQGVFVAMDYADGSTLQEVLSSSGPMDEALVRKTLLPIAKALDYAHSRKILHRDVKPTNIVIDKRGISRIMDFGIARAVKDSLARMTGHSSSSTLPYMSPEQVKGYPPSPSQDLYGLAATAYECLCGHPPFQRGQIDYQVVNEEPERPINSDSQFVDRIMAGLSKDPASRPLSCAELIGRGGSSDLGRG